MKKSLAVLAGSLAILAGVILYGIFGDGNTMSEKGANSTVESENYGEFATLSDENEAESAQNVDVATYADSELKVDVNEVVLDEDVSEELLEPDEELSEIAEDIHETTYEYAYKELNANEQEIYSIVLSSLTQYATETVLPTTNIDTLDKAFNAVLIDHPEIFYVDGYKYTKYTLGKKIMKLSFDGSYTMSKEESDALWNELDAVLTAIEMNVDASASDYDKIKYVYDTIVGQTEYDLAADNNQNIISVLIGKRSVCQGYAKTVQLLLNRMGINTTLVTGYVSNGQSHAWNLVKADGNWYYLDATWGDAYYMLAGGEDMPEGISGYTNYDYLLITSDDIAMTHTPDEMIELPVCNCMEDNYYVKEGLFFESFDENRVSEGVNRAIALGQDTVTFRCIDGSVYNTMMDELLEKQAIFKYMPGRNKKVRYVGNDKMHTLTFWL